MCENVWYSKDKYDFYTRKMIPLPCGYCIGCRIDKRSLWEKRLTSEFVAHPSAFVTFTYNDYALTVPSGASRPSINKAQFSQSVHIFRHSIKDKPLPPNCSYSFKIYAVHEYGENTLRPHVHALIFGLDWLDGKNLIKAMWPYGFVDVGPIMRGGIRYVLKYMDKMLSPSFRDDLYFDVGIEPPSTYISHGIGSDYFYAHQSEIAEYGAIKIGNRFIPVPTYWRNKLLSYNDKTMKNLFDKRKSYENYVTSFALSHGYNSYDDYLRQVRCAMQLRNEAQYKRDKVPFLSYPIPQERLAPFDEYRLYYV